MTIPDQLRMAVEHLERAISQEAKLEINQEIGTIDRILPIQREKVASLRSSAEILFSPRKHLRYGGIAEVRQEMLRTCASLRMIANQIEAATKDTH